MKKLVFPCLLLACANASAAEIVTGHVDIRFDYVPATNLWTCHLQYGGGYDEPDTEADPETVALPARDAAFDPTGYVTGDYKGDRYAQPPTPAFAFTGAEIGAPLWSLPQSDRNYTWPGFDNAQSVGTFLSYENADPRVGATARWIKIQLVSVEYSGEAASTPRFSLWTTDSGGSPTDWMATSNGIDATDCYFTTENTHSHLNWGFTELGVYRVTFRPSAYLASGGTLVENGDHAITFAIGTLATWRATHFSGADILDEAVGTPFADPDGDGLANILEYAFNTDPKVTSTAPIDAGTGTAGLPLVRVENVGGQDRLTMEFVRRKSSTNPQITYTPQFSSTLADGDWQAGGATTVTSMGETWERVKVTDSIASETRRFARVAVSPQTTIPY